MLHRKELKRRAKHNLKKHYLLFVALCLIAAFIGSEFSSSLSIINSATPESAGTYTEDSTVNGPEEGLADVILHIISGNLEEGDAQAARLTEHMVAQSEKDNTTVFGRSRGVFSMFINSITSGSLLVRIAMGLQSLFQSQSISLMILILLSMLLIFGGWFLTINVYPVIARRMFLEGHCYDEVHSHRLLFLFKIKRWLRAASTMLLVRIFKGLWWCTLIGGIIKHYSYYMVPFIVAENPDIAPRTAIRLSRRMMKGHKWECFVHELSFLGWTILGSLTLGVSNILFMNPYTTAFFTEYYAELRRLAKEKQIEDADLLNDNYLFEKADLKTLANTYPDIIAAASQPQITLSDLKGFQKFIADTFGVTFRRSKAEQAYEKDQARVTRIGREIAAAEGRVYPTRLSPFPSDAKREWIGTVHYIRHYSIWSIIVIFFALSFIGWIWEVSLHMITYGEFVNRGVLFGPWLPIYGTGSVLILLLLNKFRKNPPLEFISAITVCGLVEYFTGYYLEITHNGQRWWDYTGYYLNLHGRICAEGLLTFGLGGMLIVYVLAPVPDNLIQRISHRILIPLCVALIILFTCDECYSATHPNTGTGITDYAFYNKKSSSEAPQKGARTSSDKHFYV